MWNHSTQFSSSALLLTAAVWSGVTGCNSDADPTGVTTSEDMVAAAVTTSFGPFPGGTTIFVDVDNTTGVEDGSREHPFNTLSEGIAKARGGDGVGLAPGVYAEAFGSTLRPNYVINGLKDFRVVGMGPSKTTIRGDHSFSLIRVQNGATAFIKGLTIERGGHIRHSEGGGVQVLGYPAPVTLTLQNVILQDNEAVNGGGISAEGSATVRLINVVVANNRAGNGCGGVYLVGASGKVKGIIKNSTITENAANYLAGGICVANSAALDLMNSIVWNNSLAEVAQPESGTMNASYSDIGEGTYAGPGNISASPRFVDPWNRDYRIGSTSPAIDAGTNTGAPITDIRGIHRPHDGNGDGVAVTDMGAYEFGKIF
jgi:hypothetical protein